MHLVAMCLCGLFSAGALSLNTSVVFCNKQDGKRPLHWAAQYGESEALEKILSRRLNLQAKDERGNTALHLAAAAGHM